MRLLNKFVRDKVAPHWYDFGIQLLEDECVHKLDVIEKNHPQDVERCCTEVFNYWLQIDPEASWNKIIAALEAIGKRVLAKEVKDLVKGMLNFMIMATSVKIILLSTKTDNS